MRSSTTPTRIPSHIEFKQGTVQATDNLSVGATVPYTTGLSGANIVKNPQVFSLSAAQIQSQDNWNYQPVTDVDDLVRIRCLYNYLIEQSKPENYGRKYTTYAEWHQFTQDKCLVSSQQTVFKYGPPFQPWLIWTDGDNATAPGTYLTDKRGTKLYYLGTFHSHALWGDVKSFHDFELAVLGSMPNTSGAAGSAQTSKPAPTPGPAPGMTLSILPNPKVFSADGQNISYQFVVANTGTSPITAINVVDTLIRNIKCPTQTLSVQHSTVCSGNYTITSQDLAAKSVSDGAFASGDAGTAGPVKAQDTATIYLRAMFQPSRSKKLRLKA